jgi:hypothetical protein
MGLVISKNISQKNVLNTCSMKCKLVKNNKKRELGVFIHEKSVLGLIVTNLAFTNRDKPKDILFNSESYTLYLSAISLQDTNTYNGRRSDGCIQLLYLSIHDGQTQLLINIPIRKGGSTSGGGTELTKLVNAVESNNVKDIKYSDFDINSCIPNAPFYIGSVKLNAKGKEVPVIMFHYDDGAISIPHTTYKSLKQLLPNKMHKASELANIDNTKTLYYNRYGPTAMNANAADDDIYIECKPTGAEGKTEEHRTVDKKIKINPPIDFNTILQGQMGYYLIIGGIALVSAGTLGLFLSKKSIPNPISAMSARN